MFAVAEEDSMSAVAEEEGGSMFAVEEEGGSMFAVAEEGGSMFVAVKLVWSFARMALVRNSSC